MPAAERKKRSRQLIETVGLSHAARRPLKEYSKGMTRRIGLAQALINDPDLVLLDEPTSGLDPIGTKDMKDMILNLKEQGKTVILCSHLLADVQDVCDRIAILHQGELKELGRVDALLRKRDLTQIQSTQLTPEVEKEVCDLIRERGGQVLSTENPTSTLEDLFLSIVRESEEKPGKRAAREKSETQQ